MTVSKEHVYSEIESKHKEMFELIIKQFILIETLPPEGWHDERYNLFRLNEKQMNELVHELKKMIPFTIVQVSPRGKDLRKVVAYHDIVMYMEQIGNDVFVFVDLIRKRKEDLLSGEFKGIFKRIMDLFIFMHDLFYKAIYSFYTSNATLAQEVINQKQSERFSIFAELDEMLKNSFCEIPLEKDDITNILTIDKMLVEISRCVDNTFYIANASYYAHEGKDLLYEQSLV